MSSAIRRIIIIAQNFAEKQREAEISNLFQFIQNLIGVGEIPVEEKLIDNGQIGSGFREAREYLLHIALGLFLD